MYEEEIEIPVPWGHIAAKLYGDKADPPILVAHGVLDNAGAFDDLIPLLPKQFFYISIDLPGHGKSSHFPPFFPIHSINYVLVFKLILIHFKYDKIIIIGHSYGGQIGFKFAQVYPDLVEKLILLDTVTFWPIGLHEENERLQDVFNSCIELNNKFKTKKPPLYTYEEAIKRIQNRREGSLERPKAVENLAKRHLIPAKDEQGKYYMSIDQRTKFPLNPIQDFSHILKVWELNPIRCPILCILALNSFSRTKIYSNIVKNLLKSPNNEIVEVEGNHDVHNDKPEVIAPIITKFLLSTKSKL